MHVYFSLDSNLYCYVAGSLLSNLIVLEDLIYDDNNNGLEIST